MTTGSWSVGDSDVHSQLYASKTWSGADGKYEVWIGGTRFKWNAYTMAFRSWTQNDPGAYSYVGNIATPGDISGYETQVGWNNNDDLRLLNKLAEQVKGHSFDLGINIAEAGRTYNLILSSLRSVGAGLVSLKHGNVAGALRALGVSGRRNAPLQARDVSGRWLELQYGWRPLIDQAYEAGKALSALTGARTLRFAVSSRKTKLIDFGSPGFFNLFLNVSLSRRIYADLYEDVEMVRSLGLTNPASVVWEVVPYSFVVDWFLPVGSYLSAFGIIPKLKGRFLTISRGSQSGTRFNKTSPFPAGRKDTGLRYHAVAIGRSPSSSLSVPRPKFKRLPQALSPGHLYNAVALIHQRLR